MRKSILAAALALSASGFAVPATVHAAGQPQLSAEESARATEGKVPEQAARRTMDVKREKDVEKFQSQTARHQVGNQSLTPPRA